MLGILGSLDDKFFLRNFSNILFIIAMNDPKVFDIIFNGMGYHPHPNGI
jgi:hypothetical protein